MLLAAASGDIFASPSARQVESAIKSAPSDVGTILVITITLEIVCILEWRVKRQMRQDFKRGLLLY
jgi:dihydroxyacetone kinase